MAPSVPKAGTNVHTILVADYHVINMARALAKGEAAGMACVFRIG